MERAAWTADEELLVGIVVETPDVATGRRAFVDSLESALADRYSASTVASDAPAEVLEADPSLLVAVGDAALSALARIGADVPVVPVDAEAHLDRAERCTDAISAAFEGEAVEWNHPILAVETDDGFDGRALFDVTLVTDEPAKISEYSVRSRGASVAQLRADGVVVATPVGSHGYASAAGGPLLSSALEAVAVVPIAPFSTHRRHWVLPAADLSLAVERDEGAVALCLDDRPVGTVDPGTVVSVRVDGSLSTLHRPTQPGATRAGTAGTRVEW